MVNKVKQAGISSILILTILFGLGSVTAFRTISFFDMNSKELKKSTGEIINESLNSFSSDFERLIPRYGYESMERVLYYVSGIYNYSRVITGKDNWLFYDTKDDGNPVADYEGANSFTEKQLESAKNILIETQTKLEKKGIQFCVLIPPNKENVYYRYMPKKYKHTDTTRTDVLIKYLSENGVHIADPKADLIKSGSEYMVYYKYDTHWDELGAYIGMKKVMDIFNIQIPTLSEKMVLTDTKANEDLAKMINLSDVFVPVYGLTTTCTIHNIKDISDTDKNGVLHIHNEKAKNDSSILIVGDSFRESLSPSLAYIFKDVYDVHRNSYISGMTDKIAPDYVILEFVERYSDLIMDFELN